MDYAEILTGALGSPIDAQPVTADVDAKVPRSLGELWKAHGLAGYGEGIFWTTNPAVFRDALKEFRVDLSGPVIGRGAFADLFVLEGKEVFQVDPRQGERVLVASTLDLFFRACIADADFRADYMLARLLGPAIEREGKLGPEECFGFHPAIALGGSQDVEGIRRVKLLEHLAVLSQAQR